MTVSASDSASLSLSSTLPVACEPASALPCSVAVAVSFAAVGLSLAPWMVMVRVAEEVWPSPSRAV